MSDRSLGLFDPKAIVGAVPGHGAAASRVDEDTVELSLVKPVEHEARALVLLLPDVLRIDVCPHADSIGVFVRLLAADVVRFMHGPRGQPGWRGEDSAPVQNEAHRLSYYMELPDVALAVDLQLRTHHHAATRVAHVSAKARVIRVDPAQVSPVEPEK